MKPDNVALCFRHELEGCLQTVVYPDGAIDLIIDATKTVKTGWYGDLSFQLAEYNAKVCYQRRKPGVSIITISPMDHEYRNPHKRRQISFKLDPYGDRDIIEYLESVSNMQGLLKTLIRDHMAALMLAEEPDDNDSE